MLSIIIPTLNEEKYLPQLLDSIKKQDFRDYEIIVSDASSEDRTREIAREYGCKIVDGGLPAKGRNQGAAAAAGDLFLFLDAEVLLPDDFLEKMMAEFQARGLNTASCGLEPIGIEWVPKFIYPRFLYDLFYNWPARLLENILPFAASLILVKKEIHEKLQGFDEGIKIAEDHDYVIRASKIGRFGILRFFKLPLFLRRYQKEGIIKTNLKYLFCQIANLFGLNIRSDMLNYNFGQYKTRDEKYSPKTSLFLQILWYFACFSLAAVGLIAWFITFLILSPKIISYSLRGHNNLKYGKQKNIS